MGTKHERNRGFVQDSAKDGSASGTTSAGAGERAGADLDELDDAILRYLARNGRATNYEVGEEVGLSASAASRRILALEQSGAIRGYRALIDDRVLGKHMTVYIRVTLERQSAAVLGAFE